MAAEWGQDTLEGVSSDVAYGYTESANPVRVGPHFLRITDIQQGIVDWSKVPFCTISDENHRKYQLKSGDIVVARTGNSTGENYLFRSQADAVFASYLIRFRVDEGKADPRYVWYNLRSERWRNYINASKTGSAQAGANAKVLGQFSIPLPPIPEQRAIAHILGALDDKIELNRKMNETLASMARALFKSWFVDFDPVRAKMNGRWKKGQSLPGLPAELFDLFPSEITTTEYGDLPESWELGPISKVAGLNPEVWSKNTRPQSISYVDLSSVKWGRIEGIQSYPAAAAPSRAQRVLRPGDTIIGTVRPGNGSFALVTESGLTGSTGFAVLRPIDSNYREFVFLGTTTPAKIEALAHLADGAAYPAVRPEVVAATLVALPPKPIISQFHRFTNPWFSQIASNDMASFCLSALRDAFIPKLISGEIRLSDVGRFLRERGL